MWSYRPPKWARMAPITKYASLPSLGGLRW